MFVSSDVVDKDVVELKKCFCFCHDAKRVRVWSLEQTLTFKKILFLGNLT